MPSDNPFEEFFRKLEENMSPSEERVQAEIDYAAQIAWRLQKAYLEAGFTVDQAFELTKIQLNAVADSKKKGH